MEPNNSTPEAIPHQYSQQPTPEQPVKQKSFLLPIIGLILLFVIVGAGAYYVGMTKSSEISVTEKVISTPSIQPTSQRNPTPSGTIEELPVYPNAVFVEKIVRKPGDDPRCEPGSTYPACVYGVTSYTYSTKDSWKTVHEWYNTSSGWKLSGGAGAEGSSTSTFAKGTDKIGVIISEYPAESITKITLEVPNTP